MSDESFQKLLDKIYSARSRLDSLVKKGEAEYERRYGENPSEVDDDIWIDFVGGYGGPATVESVEESATQYAKLKRVKK